MNLVVCDFDGVLTRLEDEDGNNDQSSFLNFNPDSYSPCKELVDRLKTLCIESNSKILVSSNWRRFADDGFWEWRGKRYFNQLPLLRKMLEGFIHDTLPLQRHINKAEAFGIWIQKTRFSGNYVIFDDQDEGFSSSLHFSTHFIQTNERFGLSLEDCIKAKKILSGNLS